MSRRQIPLVLLSVITMPFMADAEANNVWQGSYSVNGQCFCIGELPSTVAGQIVPSPIGGQTVKQVCTRLGPGPGLSKEDGRFSYPVYKDPQCGNGPFATDNEPRDPDCVGSRDGTYGSCQSAGPKWNLAQAYASPAAAMPATSPAADADGAADATAAIVVVAGTRPATGTEESGSTASVNVRTDSSDKASDTKDSVLAGFTGKVVVLGSDRYLQARDGVPVNGGKPGSRIILDGVLFLRHDADLQVSELYSADAVQEVRPPTPARRRAAPSVPTPDTQRANSARSQNTEPARLARTDSTVTDTASPDAGTQLDTESVARARIAMEQSKRDALARREAQARAEFEEVRRARRERLARQNDQQQAVDSQASVSAPVDLTESPTAPEQVVVTDDQQFSEPAAASNAAAGRSEESSEEPVLMSALPAIPESGGRLHDFSYIEAMPASYDFGGGGLVLEGSAQNGERLLFLGRLGIADSYQEVMVGGGYLIAPASAPAMSIVLLAGVEFGSFELVDEVRAPAGRTLSDNGLYAGALGRFVINSRFELKGGVGYSSFFGGDATVFGAGYYHATRRLDVMSSFELGDNDLFGIGIRYFY